ncbi:MAG: PDZ domain-containing protein [Hydrogenimonas sp.]|nr:PDZ domain-containing protein [Hydrogenimonas sp.]
MLFCRTLAAVLLLTIALYGVDNGCFKFFPGSFKIVNGHTSFAVAKDRFVSFKCPPDKKVVAEDRLKGLCLFEDRAEKPLYLSDIEPPLYICPDKKVLKNPFKSYPYSIYAGELKMRPDHEGAIFSGCCRLAAIFDGSGRWFGAKSIRKLLKNETIHGDIGARFVKQGDNVAVESVDPFLKVGLMEGDIVFSVGSKKEPALRDVEVAIDSCKEGSSLKFVVNRGGSAANVDVKCFRRMGGGAISDTFLERFGMEFDHSLKIVRIEEGSILYKRGLRAGDRLLAIDGKSVKSEADVRDVLSRYATQKSTPQNMLWERGEFQFFLLPTAL